MTIEITDVVDLALSVSDASPSFGDEVTWTASVSPLPAGATNVRYRWAIKKKYGTNDAKNWEDFNSSTDPTLSWTASETEGHAYVEAKVTRFRFIYGRQREQPECAIGRKRLGALAVNGQSPTI